VKENPASKIKPPQATEPPVLPFTDEEMAAILKAVKTYPDKANAVRLRALVLLLRYSGLRITDAAMLSRERIKGGKLMLRTAKTGAVVYLPLPPFVLEALDACPGKQFPFWTGLSKPISAGSIWQRTFRRLFKLAGVPAGHPHRFRHSFAIGLLLAGIPIEDVSTLLGHTSVKTTIKCYAPWTLRSQQQLEEAVKKTWNQLATVTQTAHKKILRSKQRKTQ
jgi:integrase/recombinase XerD